MAVHHQSARKTYLANVPGKHDLGCHIYHILSRMSTRYLGQAAKAPLGRICDRDRRLDTTTVL
jgi:hypothetical protein